MARETRRPRTVGLDKPCKICGKPIHYTYTGPVEGVCGRCVDKKKPRKPGGVRRFHHAMVLQRGAPPRPPNATALVVKFCLVILVGGAAVMAALMYLTG